MVHTNIVRFIGMVLDDSNIVVIHEYCSKGSLQVGMTQGHFQIVPRDVYR